MKIASVESLATMKKTGINPKCHEVVTIEDDDSDNVPLVTLSSGNNSPSYQTSLLTPTPGNNSPIPGTSKDITTPTTINLPKKTINKKCSTSISQKTNSAPKKSSKKSVKKIVINSDQLEGQFPSVGAMLDLMVKNMSTHDELYAFFRKHLVFLLGLGLDMGQEEFVSSVLENLPIFQVLRNVTDQYHHAVRNRVNSNIINLMPWFNTTLASIEKEKELMDKN